MKFSLAIPLLTIVAALHAPAALPQAEPDAAVANLESEDARIAYALGMNVGMNLASQGLLDELDPQLFLAGMADALSDEAGLSPEEMFAALEIFQQRQQELMQQQAAANELAAAETLAAGMEFLSGNGERDEVVTLASGLQYEVLQSGPGGASPTASDGVVAHYHGTLTDGTIFDSSVDRGEPASFMLSQVIPGWTEALQLMSVGDQWRLFIPAELAYGETSPTPTIPPNSVLIFDVELLEIVE